MMMWQQITLTFATAAWYQPLEVVSVYTVLPPLTSRSAGITVVSAVMMSRSWSTTALKSTRPSTGKWASVTVTPETVRSTSTTSSWLMLGCSSARGAATETTGLSQFLVCTAGNWRVGDSQHPPIAFFSYQLDSRCQTDTPPLRGDGAEGGGICRTPPPPKKKLGKYIWGKYHVKFGHFVNFSYAYLRQKCPVSQIWLNFYVYMHTTAPNWPLARPLLRSP